MNSCGWRISTPSPNSLSMGGWVWWPNLLLQADPQQRDSVMHGFKVGTWYAAIPQENLEVFQPRRRLAEATSVPTDFSANPPSEITPLACEAAPAVLSVSHCRAKKTSLTWHGGKCPIRETDLLPPTTLGALLNNPYFDGTCTSMALTSHKTHNFPCRSCRAASACVCVFSTAVLACDILPCANDIGSL